MNASKITLSSLVIEFIRQKRSPFGVEVNVNEWKSSNACFTEYKKLSYWTSTKYATKQQSASWNVYFMYNAHCNSLCSRLATVYSATSHQYKVKQNTHHWDNSVNNNIHTTQSHSTRLWYASILQMIIVRWHIQNYDVQHHNTTKMNIGAEHRYQTDAASYTTKQVHSLQACSQLLFLHNNMTMHSRSK